ncbi:MAG TPA: hypothetical protein VHW01_27300 [Polyangiaceae bacterium]|jgi:hypothetical protein|nr:hypothetical protein [Polyangiaceae bacterium]
MANLLTTARRLVCVLEALEIDYPVARSASAFTALISASAARVLREDSARFYCVEDDFGRCYPAAIESISEPVAGGRMASLRGFLVPR